MRNVRIGHLTRVRVSTIRKFFRYVQEGVPAKLCQIHVMNCVSFFDKILSLIKPFMKAEIFKVVSVTLHSPQIVYELQFANFYTRKIIKNKHKTVASFRTASHIPAQL